MLKYLLVTLSGLLFTLATHSQTLDSLRKVDSTKSKISNISLVDTIPRRDSIPTAVQSDLELIAQKDSTEISEDTVLSNEDSLTSTIRDTTNVSMESAQDSVLSTLDSAQNLVVGQVVDNTGQPIVGATILIHKGQGGTQTDEEGKFQIAANSNDSLNITFLGYNPLSVAVAGQSNLQVQMTLEGDDGTGTGTGAELDEVVVIGYGTAKKKDLTGAQTNVSGAELANRNQMNLSQSMQGTMPGVTATRRSSAGNQGADILVRGITSVGSNTPLYVVDGVPVGTLNDVNPQDIDDVTVLKDAASASIYGARAAAGVILITTKRGRQDNVGIEYTGLGSIIQPTKLPNGVGVTRYLEMMNEMSWNDAGNIDGGNFPIYTEDDVANWLNYSLTDFTDYPVTDWRALLLKSNAMRQNHSISIAGGSEKLQSRASITYDQMGELYDHKDFQRIQSRFNNSYHISEKFSADMDLSYIIEDNKSPRVNPIRAASTFAPIYAAIWPDGQIADGKTGDNIYAKLQYGGFDNILDRKLNARFALHFSPIEGLKFSGVVAPTLYNRKRKIMTNQVPYFAPDDPDLIIGYMSGFQRNTLDERREDITNITKQFLVNYTKSLGDHNLNVLGGYEDYISTSENLGAVGDYMALNLYPYLNVSQIEYQSNSGSASQVAYRSFFGRLIYDFQGKYLLQANLRYDGSSRFHPDHRWGAFPSVSAGWILTEESFMEDNGIFDFLKVRVAWGRLGNERIGSNYPYQRIMAFGNTLFFRGDNVVTDLTASQTTYAIPDISWETTETQNLGFDMNFFDNRLTVVGDIFNKRTFNMLLPLEIPKYMGYDNPQQNAGTMSSRGWEVQIGWKDQIDEFNYGVSFNLSDSRSTMGNMGGRIMFNGNMITREGSEYLEWYGYRSDGIFQNQAEIDGAAVTSPNVKPGDIRYVDLGGAENGPDGRITPDNDRVLLGGSLPRYTYGAIVNLGYKNIDMSISLQGIGKINSYLSRQMIEPFQSQWLSPPEIIDGNYWSMYNSEAENLNADYPRLSANGISNNYAPASDFWLFNGAYLRLKNVSIGYTLPQQWMDGVGIKGLRIFANGTDLLSFDRFPKGWDPEMTATSPEAGWDPATGASSYIGRTINLGVSLKF